MGNFRNRSRSYRSSYSSIQSSNQPESQWKATRARELSEDALLSFYPLPPGSAPRVGWLLNMVACTIEEPLTRRPVQAVDLFFLSEEQDFKATVIARPYMYLRIGNDDLQTAEIALRKRFAQVVADISTVELNDLASNNHLANGTSKFLKFEARTTSDLFSVRKVIEQYVARNNERRKRGSTNYNATDALENIVDMREYDVPPVNRLAIDQSVNVGYWYSVTPGGTEPKRSASRPTAHHPDVENDPDINEHRANDLYSAHLERLPQIVERANPVVFAYDIECTKKPLKFPDAEAGDQVMMISWMVDGVGFLGINREVVSKDIEPFEHKPHAEFGGDFTIFNEMNERQLLKRFFSEIRINAPRVFVTYNGDFFDWPFVEKRAALLGLDMGQEIGMRGAPDDQTKETRGRTALHMDVFHWVNRDSYLPQGSRGLKAVTRILLGFEPEEIPPEEMVAAAKERPDEMAKYSVSDAVCTYYLYMKYVHPFIFSLCNIIPLNPDDVLRKGSGTLCEMLLMCQAREKKIIAPNKVQASAFGKLTEDGHVLESETYIGGHVEAIRTGVYRSDLPLQFNINVEAIEDLERTLDETLRFAIVVEGKTKLEDVTNYDEVRKQILDELQRLKEKPSRSEKPLIYHLDVSAMYPNIILTNRLQPHAVVTPAQCAACDFNGMSDCQRNMDWTWRGEFYPASRGEAEMIQRRAAQEQRDKERRQYEERQRIQSQQNTSEVSWMKDPKYSGRSRNWQNERNRRGSRNVPNFERALPSFEDEESRKDEVFRKRLKDYCRTNYRRTQQTRIVEKRATVCQRENPFYVDTVRAFRDRRYEYKALLKKQKKLRSAAKSSGDAESLKSAEKLVVLYDSLQLAHKCILNSFYGYVMRRGARWYSMEMAGIVTNTGGLIIKRAREFIDKVGLPLELDTDGIWCVLPVSFPENFNFKTKSGKKVSMSYICSIFNSDVANNFTNHQYQDLVDPEVFEYEQRSECSIVFEVDGPYKAMVLPSSLEEGKNIKKRYAVFNDDGSLAELKGFEIKRRGELKLIKEFQGEIFKRFLEGTTMADCYKHVGDTCNKWLDVILSKGEGKTDEEVLELLVEQNNMSKPLQDYLIANQKSCAITCATRMKEFLGDEIVRDSGLATMYVIASKPEDDQVTQRAIPVKIFEVANPSVRKRLLRKWLKTGKDEYTELRNLLDWDYYRGRLANAVLKIVSIPAALQGVENPVPRIEYPPWLVKRCRELQDKRKQKKVSSFFNAVEDGKAISMAGFKSLRDAQNDTERLSIEDVEDLPIRSWTAAKVAHRRAEAVVKRKCRTERKVRKLRGSFGIRREELLLKSNADDPETRAAEGRDRMLALIREPHPDKRYDYAGWVRYAKRIWRAQRSVRLHRYSAKRAREAEDDESEEEPVPESETLLGGTSFAVRFGTRRPAKRRKNGVHSRPDYAPINFLADLTSPVLLKQAFFKTKSVPLLGPGVVWQNIAISPVADKFGEFNLWVMPIRKERGKYESGMLYSIPLHVKRTIYCNSYLREPPQIPGISCEIVRGLTLPRSKETHNLYKLEIDEERFQQTDKDVTSIIGDSSALDGVYGTRSPLHYETIVNLGTICAPKRAISSNMTTKKLLSQGIRVDDINPKGSDSAPYLKDCQTNGNDSHLQQAYLYGSHSNDNSGRGLYMLVAPQAKLVHAVTVSRTAGLTVNLKRTWRQVMSDRMTQAAIPSDEDGIGDNEAEVTPPPQVPELPSDCEFKLDVFDTRKEAWAKLHQILSKLRSGSSLTTKTRATGMKTILLAQWPASDTEIATEAMFGANAAKSSSVRRRFSVLEQCIPASRNYPVVKLSIHAEDGNYLPVGWESRAVSTAFKRYADVSNWLTSQLPLARFSGIPVGNISSTDMHSQALDVLIGRELTNRAHVLWSSSSPQPDLGGIEEDDYNLQYEIPPNPEVSNPGSYRTVCIDTELSNLSIATILSSSVVNQLEGTDLAFDSAANMTASSRKSRGSSSQGAKEGTIRTKSAGPLDEMALSAPAFAVLKDLVSNWDKIAGSDESEIGAIARALLDHIYRWTRSECAFLYDPALARFVGWLIKKVFKQLISELKNLGATVVYASLSRIILATPKTHAIDGLRYAGFLEKTLKDKTLFKHVHLEPLLGVYSGLLFVDRLNYGALPAPEEQLVLSGELDQVQSSSSRRVLASRNIPNVRMIWDIARYLPLPVGVLWSQVVEEFIRRPLVQRLRLQERDVEEGNESSEEARKRKKNMLRPRGDGYYEEVRALVKSLSGQLLEKTHEIRVKASTLTVPNVPCALEEGSRNIVLEFVRSLCYVLALDTVCNEQVAELRRSLLQIIGVREFSKDARFVEPGLPVVIHDVICTFCNGVVDIDVGRDCRIWESEDGSKGWRCEYCGNSYDRELMEMNLVKMAQKIYTSFQVQDSFCGRCRMVCRENMSIHCNCSGLKLANTMSGDSMKGKLRALKRVAEFHGFEMLQQTVGWLVDAA